MALASLPAQVRGGLQAKASSGKILKVESLTKHGKLGLDDFKEFLTKQADAAQKAAALKAAQDALTTHGSRTAAATSH